MSDDRAELAPAGTPAPVATVTPTVAALLAAGAIAEVDAAVADTLGRLHGESSELVLLGAALAVRAPRHSHVCFQLDDPPQPLPTGDLAVPDPSPRGTGSDHAAAVEVAWPDPDRWTSALADSPLVRVVDRAADDLADDVADDVADSVADGEADDGDDSVHDEAPLVLWGNRLYLDRYWRHEQRVRAQVTARSTRRLDVDPGDVGRLLPDLFDSLIEEDGSANRQAVAAATAALANLTVLTGGPGTGKTTTVVRIAALVSRLLVDGGHTPRLALCAPTGKAAARLGESLRSQVAGLGLDAEVARALADAEPTTIHRLLGTRSQTPTRFRHHADDPLPHDLVVVDEASMIGVGLMARLLDAVRPDARLVLVGDRDQLTSVDAGSVLGDLCGPEPSGGPARLRLAQGAAQSLTSATGLPLDAEVDQMPTTGVWDGIVPLVRSHRFGRDTGIGALAHAIREAGSDPTGDGVVALLDGRHRDVRAWDGSLTDLIADVVETHVAGGVAAAARGDGAAALAALDRSRILCAMNRGPQGVARLNQLVEEALADRVDGFDPADPWYPGRPVLVTTNDYGVGLFNGDLGVVVTSPDDPSRRLVAFPGADHAASGGLTATPRGHDREEDALFRLVSSARVPAPQTAHALSIHKSQGSQFAHVVVVLPDRDRPLLTRELVYTAVTRASTSVTLAARDDVLRRAVARPVRRATGLADSLWPPDA